MATHTIIKDKDMSANRFGFGTPAPERVEAPKLATSGLSGFEHEIKPKDKQTFKFLVLHGLEDCFQVNVHRLTVLDPGNGYRQVPAGSYNTHLPFLNPPVPSPFESDPDGKVRGWKTTRYMLVFVLESPNDKLTNHVAYLELRDNYKRKDGSFNLIEGWEKTNGLPIEGRTITYSRTGTGLQDTSYQTNILVKTDTLSDAQTAIVEKELPEVRDYILSLYNKEWTTEEFTRLYNLYKAVVDAPVRTADENVRPTHPVAKSEEDEIPF